MAGNVSRGRSHSVAFVVVLVLIFIALEQLEGCRSVPPGTQIPSPEVNGSDLVVGESIIAVPNRSSKPCGPGMRLQKGKCRKVW
jgi:hypothetical protein